MTISNEMTVRRVGISVDQTDWPSRQRSFTSTFGLVRLILRRDRIRLTLWIVGLVVIMVVSADQLADLYRTPEQIQTYVDTVGDNPALVIFSGPGHGFDDPTLGSILVNETSSWMALAVALMGIFTVNRHTRAEEDEERADLLRSGVVGRHAAITASLMVVTAANVVIAGAALVALVILGFPAAGSIALCASIALVGICFASFGALAAQVAPSGRATLGLATVLTGVAFIVRGMGDVAAPALTWLTPFGWGLGIRAFADERWWVLAGLATFAAGATIAAYELSVRRDLGSGILPSRPGPTHASRWSTSPVGLALRLQRGAVAGWSVGLIVTGAVYGSIGNEIEALVENNPELAEFLVREGGGSLADNYLATALSLMAMLTSGFALSSTMRARSAEVAGLAELVLATPTSRTRWLSAQVAIAVVGSALILFAAGLGAGITYAWALDDVGQIPRLVGAALVMFPAVLAMIGITIALTGWLPSATVAAWGVFAAFVVAEVFGPVLGIPTRILELSPFGVLPASPAEGLDGRSIATVIGVATVLTLAGQVGFARRDLNS